MVLVLFLRYSFIVFLLKTRLIITIRIYNPLTVFITFFGKGKSYRAGGAGTNREYNLY